mmetsp:Transcript_3655/g.4580  ORF Transcript_3655/g.4580 Transcript_3655/m.4580 type:complete len:157 (+) Transcript_3655:109-579(+)|eukprot:CAMPEP_0204834646 /NCGR_PEP_ID=MMETSP1346-20131115/20290_1 /ASSEMBLY_ACC=CAM_ASM_000771 /TAXON_ID=215587 /ORGANISM="Aplanochytrium stocchinoi, Strain GSBS06" /LENGTH=156 /DNA_ID=CAMNT_0051968063 /DNA_START=114 /DNA_END=584 /DNA_ORIENTATION=-
MSFKIETPRGSIVLQLREDAAPETCKYIRSLIDKHKLYDGSNFYRSDFVLQCGTHGLGRNNPEGDLKVNETHLHTKISNTRGTASIAHWDVPDCGNSEFFINLKANTHLDEAYGGYCVFAQVDPSDKDSYKTMDSIAEAIKQGGGKVEILKIAYQS